MPPERTSVFVAEDDPTYREIIEYVLTRNGHQVVITATTLAKALAAVEQLTALGVQVAVIDGNLHEWDTSGDDGRKILEAIRTHAPGIKTIGLSSNIIPGTDIHLDKEEVRRLGQVVTDL